MTFHKVLLEQWQILRLSTLVDNNNTVSGNQEPGSNRADD